MTLPSKVIIVGAGPVGCYAAARLCQTRLVSEVHVYEKQEKIGPERTAGRNVNVTLCQRGKNIVNENLPMQYTYIFSPVKIEQFQLKIFYIFLIFAQNIDCGYKLELPRQGGSNEYPQSYVLEQK